MGYTDINLTKLGFKPPIKSLKSMISRIGEVISPTYYHDTHASNLNSILRQGLDFTKAQTRAFPTLSQDYNYLHKGTGTHFLPIGEQGVRLKLKGIKRSKLKPDNFMVFTEGEKLWDAMRFGASSASSKDLQKAISGVQKQYVMHKDPIPASKIKEYKFFGPRVEQKGWIKVK